ncbi:MAG: hypothetical protein AAGA66_12050 [Bacteroidota bacterium]
MKHGIIIPFYNDASVLNMETAVQLSVKFDKISLCFINNGNRNSIRSAISRFEGDLSENIYIINVSESTRKVEAIKEGAMFLFNETNVDTIGFIDPEQSESFSEYSALMETYDKTSDQIVSALKKEPFWVRDTRLSWFSNVTFSMIRTMDLLVTHFKKKKERCVAKMFNRKVVPYIFRKDVLTDWLFDVKLLSGRSLKLKSR